MNSINIIPRGNSHYDLYIDDNRVFTIRGSHSGLFTYNDERPNHSQATHAWFSTPLDALTAILKEYIK